MALILVVDDSSVVRADVSKFFNEHGIDVLTANDGKDGLDKLKENPGIKLVFADINMPIMDGLTMVEKMKSELKTNAVIFMLTTENNAAMKTRGKAAGVKGWMVKPFDGNNILAPVKKIIGV